jgi:tetratricopeptide (TPR) repeat protein
MGRVYRAERADGAYAQQVAVKVTRVSLVDREAARRFRAERAILAGLTHPNIVRLLDGGTLPSSQAWLAMELVDGKPITRVALDAALPLVARLRLFRDVCAAVHYAHQHGVVHRDLKPQNVLVGADGAAKVVDFGVAKLLDARPGDADANATSMTRAPLTPNYASPEQLRGLAVTTASDVYALGVLLYELLTDAKPYETTGKPLDEVLAIVLEREPARPSLVSLPDGTPAGRTWPRRGDLDAIVSKAMAKPPERRYASAAELAGDVGRYLDARPVQAQEPSFAYVASRLVRRHAAAFGVAAVALVAVIASLGVSLWQTRVAERERTRAETRLVEVRQLANSLVFKVHDAVASLDGSTPVRQTIVEEAIAYLERLAAEPGEDPTLRLELVEAYTRVARAQGDPQVPNLGDRTGAISSFSQALALVEPLLQTTELRVRAAALRAAGRAKMGLASVYGAQGRGDDARATARQVVAHAEALRDLQPTDDRSRGNLAAAYFTLAQAQYGTPEALETWRKSRAINEALLAEQPDDPDRMRNVALVAKYLSAQYEDAKQWDAAERETARALELDERRLALAPSNRLVQFDVSNDLTGLASLRTAAARYEDARALLDRALALRHQMAASDPKDVLAPGKIGSVEWRHAWNALEAGRQTEARTWAERAVRTLKAVRARTDDAVVLRDLAAAQFYLALSLDNRNSSCEAVGSAQAIVEELRARKVNQTWVMVDERLPSLAAACGRR